MYTNASLNYITKHFITFVSFVLILGILIISVKGTDTPSTPKNIYDNLRSETMPFELSPERGRFALLTSVSDGKTVYFSNDIAKYILPDLGYYENKFVSLFPPGVSYFAIPLYTLGKYIGYSQYFAFLTVSLVAFLNCFLIFKIIVKLGGSFYAGILSSLAFIFGTTSYAYAITLYQHHFISLFLLLGIYLLFDKKLPSLLIVYFLSGIIFFVEYQSLLFYLPVLIIKTFQYLRIREINNKLIFSLKTKVFYAFLILILSLIPFFYYNKITYNKYFKLAGTVQGVSGAVIDPKSGNISVPKENPSQSLSSFFQLYKLPSSMSVLLTSKDRGLIYFSPVIIFSFIGIMPLMKKKKYVSYAVFSIATLIFILYGMWGDPWGGWAFGTRYLIPAFAVMSIPLGMAINSYGKKWLFAIPFLLVMIYSVFINLSGALTTNQIPPSIEVDSQRYPQYTFLYNIKLAFEGKTSSFIYKTFIPNIDFRIFYLSILFTIILLIIVNYLLFVKEKRYENN